MYLSLHKFAGQPFKHLIRVPRALQRSTYSLLIPKYQPLGSFSRFVIFRGRRPVKRDAKNLRVHIHVHLFYLNFRTDLTERRPLILFLARVGASLHKCIMRRLLVACCSSSINLEIWAIVLFNSEIWASFLAIVLFNSEILASFSCTLASCIR